MWKLTRRKYRSLIVWRSILLAIKNGKERERKRKKKENKSTTFWRRVIAFVPTICSSKRVCACSAPCPAVSKDCFLYLLHRNARDTRPMREPRTSFGSLGRFSPSIRSARNGHESYFYFDFWRYSHGPAQEISTKSASRRFAPMIGERKKKKKKKKTNNLFRAIDR